MKRIPVFPLNTSLTRNDAEGNVKSRYQAIRRRLLRLVSVFLLALAAFLISFFWLLGYPSTIRAAGGTHYVTNSGVDSSNCSVSAPCRTIQQAVSNAAAGDEVRVAAGTYTGTITLNKNLSLRGGFTSTNWLTSNPTQNPTIINAQSLGRVIHIPSAVVVTVDGFHLTGGSATDGAGVYNQSGTLTLINNQIYGNVAGGNGGGVYNQATLTSRGNQIFSNTANNAGGGLFFFNVGTTIVEATKIFSNTAQVGGGTYINNGPVTIRSSLFYRNMSTNLGGGGIFVQAGNVKLENNTIYENEATGDFSLGGGIYAFNSTLAITNGLIISNTADLGGGVYSDSIGSGFRMAYTDFFGNSTTDFEDTNGIINPTTLGTNNRINNPNFVAPQTLNLHLPSSGSLALNSGISSSAAIDIDGEGRPFGAAMDRGADEYIDLSSSCYARVQNGQVYTTVQAAVDAAGAGGTVQVAGRCVSSTGQQQTVLLNKNLTVRGGYTVTDWLNASYGPTILDANSQGRVISVTGAAVVTLDSLHITGGSAAGDGAGVYLDSTGLATLRNNAIYGNTSSGGTSNGAGLYNSGRGSAVVQHTTFYNNTAGGQGSGLYASSSGGSGTVTLQNSIIANHTGSGIATSLAGRLTSNYNDYFSNSGGHLNGPVSFGANDLVDISPSFQAPAANPPNFHLLYTSPLINAADPASTLTTDFENDPRPQGTRSDIGADESAAFPGVIISDAPGRVFTDVAQIQGQTIIFNHTITNTGLNPSLSDTFNLSISNSHGWPASFVGISSPVTLASGASQSFQVVVTVPVTLTSAVYNQTIITATSQANATTFDTAIDLIATPGVQLAPNYDQSGKPGEVLTYTHTLTNIGPSTDSYIITINSPAGWGQLVAPTQPITLASGATALVTVRAQITDTAPANLADVMRVTATSLTFSGVTATAVDTTTAKATVGDRYVATTGQDTDNNCVRSDRPCATISHAVGQTAFSDTVRVAGGTYPEAGILINQYINLRGGFSTGNWITPDPGLNPTVIDAQNTERGLLIQVSPPLRPLIEGFTIMNGATSGVGGGVYVQGSSAPTLTRLIILNSSATRGGGIYVETGNPILQEIVISNTTATQGGGIYQAGGTVTISQTRLSGSTATNGGGGFYSAGGTANVWNNFIFNNRVTGGTGGGIYKGTGTLNSINNTLVGNQASTFGGGIYANNTTALVISNSIVVSNTATTGGGIYRTGGGSVSVNYNDVWNNSGGDYSGVTAGANSFSTAPLFVDAAAGDFHLTLTSPALDSGDPNTFLRADIDGEQRPFNQGFDMGADEIGGCLAQIEGDSTIYTVLQQAVDTATSGATIRISGICRGAQGRLVNGQVLSQTVIVTKNLTLRGGYNSVFNNDPDTSPEPTFLDAQNQGRVVVVTDTVNVAISHLTLTGGNAAAGGGTAGGGGVYNAADQLKLEGMVITGNQATFGGGIYLLTGTLLAGNTDGTRPNTISNNTAVNGGGLYINGGSAVISHTTITSNTATTDGGGVYSAGGLMSTQSLTITYNSAANGGGLHNAATGALTLINSIVASNTASSNGGGLYNASNNLAVRHDNFYANNAAGQGGGIYHSASGSGPVINSSVIMDNSSGSGGSGIHNNTPANLAFNYNDVFNNTNVGATGTGNISVDPAFLSTDLASGSFLRIAGGSPLQDAGDPASPVLSDIDGDPRPSNQSFDIGIDEVGGCFVRINLQPPTYGSVQYAVGLSNPGDTLNVAGTCQGVNPFVDAGQTVSQTVFLTKSLTIQGGYNKDNWAEAPDPLLYPTTLDALNLGRVAYITNSAVISIGSLNLVRGTATDGGGIYIGSGVLTLTHNSIYSNTATNGGAFYNIGGTATLDSNDLRNNQAGSGGAVFHAGGVSLVQNNIIRSNAATTNGGGIYNNAGNNLTVRHNTVYANNAVNGGGFYNNSGTPTIVNTIFATNTVTTAGHAIFSAVSLTARYNNAYPAANAYNANVTPANSLTLNPNFVDAPAGDFHLQNTSPILDRGDPAMTLLYDFEGDFRPGDQGFDIGADERTSCRARILRTGVIYGNIQDAVNNSIPGDEVQVSVGVCQGVHTFVSGGQTLSQTVHITHNLTLHGGFSTDFSSGGDAGPLGYPDASASTIDALNLGRPILVTNSVVITIMRFNLVNGNATGLGGGPGGAAAGGGLYYRGSQGNLEHVDFYSNTAAYGGALYNAGTNLSMLNSWINYNVATVNGGALYNATGVFTITGDPEPTRIYSNTAASLGGGIYNDSGQVRLLDNNSAELTLNRANQGGFAYNNSGQMTLENNIIFENQASLGAALYNNTGTMSLDRGNRLLANAAATDGGGIYNGAGTLSVRNTLIYGNTALDQGAGIYLTSGNPSILHNTFYQNNANSQGGGVFVNTGGPTIVNNIFDANTAGAGSAVYAPGTATLNYNDYWTANGAAQVAGGATPGANSLNVNPGFTTPNLQPDADFHLQLSSVLINAAQDVGVPNDFEADPRPINSAPDVGADEYNSCLARVASSGIIYGRIQTALNNATSGDTIQVAEGICEENITIDKNITISGSWLADFSGQVDPSSGPVTIVDALVSNRVITVTNAAGVVSLARLTIMGGNTGSNGGGIQSQANQLTLTSMAILSNTAASGGGVYIGGGLSATLRDVLIVGNQATSSHGGGLYNGASSNVTIIDGGMVRNTAAGAGGAIYNDIGSTVSLAGGAPVEDNQAQNGGGIYNNAATFTLINKQVNGNQAVNDGGGIHIAGASTIDLTNLGLYNNRAVNGAGFYRSASGSAALYHATIRQNIATGQGGGIYNLSSSMVLSSSIIAFNTAASGASGVQGPVNIAYTMRETSNTYSGVTLGTGNIDGGNPNFRPGDTGGDLLYTSPAIDAVPTLLSHVTVDRYNETRPQLCAKDMGRDEYLVGARTLTWAGPVPAGPETVAPTEAATYTFSLRNDSENWTSDVSLGIGTGYTETLTLTLNSSQNWGQLIGVSGGSNPTIISDTLASVSLAPGQTVTMTVRVTVPAGTFADQSENTFLTYEALQCIGGTPALGISNSAVTNVEQGLKFIIAPDNLGAALPGQTITYTHIVTNLGNITDTYTIVPGANLYAPGAIAQPPDPSLITLGPLQTATVVMSVTVDPAAAGGLTGKTNILAISSLDPSLQESALDSTVISYTTGTRYVSLDGTDSLVDETIGNPDPNVVNSKDNNCTQPNQGACRTLQQAINQAADGDLIKIDQGVYDQPGTDILTATYQSQTLTQIAFINKSVTLQGGYDKDKVNPDGSDGWQENPPSHISQTTTIDVQGLGRNIYVTAGISATIDRLNLVNGGAVGLGGGPGGQDAGANVYNDGADLTLSANRIYNNNFSTEGSDNLYGGGLYSGGGNLYLYNNLFHDGAATDGGAVYIGGGTATVVNNSFHNNFANGQGSALYAAGASLGLTNTIFANNNGGVAVEIASGSTALDYNLYFNNAAGDINGAAAGPNDVSGDPLFAAPGDTPPNLHLQVGSQALDVGDPATTLAIDYDNELRPLGLGFDIGADERKPSQALLFYPDTFTTTLAGSTVVQTHTLENQGDLTDTFTISAASSQPGWGITFDQPVPYTITLGAGLIQTVVVTYNVPATATGQTSVTFITATSSLTTVFATVTDTIQVSSPQWQISKTVTPTPTVRPGEQLTYTIFITNIGDLDSTGPFTITDPLPANTDFVSASPPGTFDGTDITWVFNTPVISNGGGLNVSFVVAVTQPLTSGITIVNQNYTVAGGGAPDPAVGVPVAVTVDASASLSISKTADPSPAQPGDLITYTITISNDAAALGPADNVVVSDTLPAEVIYQSMGFVAPASGIITDTGSPTLLWQLADPIPAGGSAQVTVTGRVTVPLAADTILTNTFSATASNVAAVVSGTLATPVTTTNIITLAKTVVPTTTVPGGLVTYTLTLSNSGNGLANVTITDSLGSGFNPPTYTTSVVVPGRTDSTPAGVVTVTFTAAAPITQGVYPNQLVTASYDLTQTTLSNTAPVTVEVPTVDFSSIAYSVDENAGPATITVTLSAASAVTATVSYSTADGTATAGSDYTGVSGLLTFSPGITSQSFTVPVTNDVTFEGDETVTLTLSAPGGATLGGVNNPATLTIVEDDTAPVVDFSSIAYSVAEDAGTATITVTLSPASTVTATVNYATSNGTATAGSDYTAAGGLLTFTPGITLQTFTVPITDDALLEGDETVILTLSGATNAQINGPNTPATLTIVDNNDPAPEVSFSSAAYSVAENAGPAVITVTLSTASGITTSVAYSSSNGTAIAGSDYTGVGGQLTFAPGITELTFLVPVTDDSLFEGDETVALTLSAPVSATLGSPNTATLTIVENETAPTFDFSSAAYSVNENGGSATITVTLSAASAVTATVTYSTSDGTAIAGSDYTGVSGLLTFAPGVTLQTFTVPISDDTFFELDETVDLSLSGAVNANPGLDAATLTIVNDDATPQIDFSSAAYSVDEGVGSATITVTLSGAFPLTATVDYATTAGSATAGSDYTNVGGTLTFTPGVTSLTFNVPITDDLLYESNETITLTLSNPVSTTIGANSPAVLTIVDNDTPTADFSSATYSVDETAGTATITVTLSTAPTLAGSIGYASSNNTATAGSDYTAVSNTLTLNVGQTVYTFTVPILDDLSFEGNETLTLTLSNPSNAALGSANNPTVLTIIDNDPLPTVAFSSPTYSVSEAGGSATITVTLSGSSILPASVGYATSNGTATAGSDYLTRTGTLTFTPGITLLTFTVPVTNDTVFEGDETVNLTLSAPVSATLGITNPATLTIVDDETAPTVGFSSAGYSVNENGGSATITVTLSAASSITASVGYATSNGTATAGSDYVAQAGTLTFSPGTTSLTFTVPITNDIIQEGSETITLTLSAPVSATLGITNPATLTIVDDDDPTVDFSSAAYSVNENGGSATITVTLSAPPDLAVSVNYASSNGTATAGSDYTAASGILTFTPGITLQTFTVPITDDALFENNETVRLTLSAPANAILGSTNNPATLTILDNDTAPTLAFSSPTYGVNEGAGTATITVTLSAASGLTATVTYATIQNTASAGLDYLGAGGTLTFAPGVTSQTFAVTILNDTLFENSETVTLTLSAPVSATLGITNPATLTIIDNDTAPTVSFNSPAYSVSEAGGSATITVTLSAASGLTATVNYATSNGTATAGSDYTAASGTLTFAPGVTGLTFSIPITNDTLLETNETVTLTLSNPVSATLGANTPVALTIVDNDTPIVNFSSAAYSVNEGAGTAAITATLSFASSLTATVNYGTSNGTATAGSDYVAQSGTLTFSPGITRQTFLIPVTDDALFEGNETVTLTLSAATNALLGGGNNPATLTIVENDASKTYLPLILRDFTPPIPPPANGPDMVVTNIVLTPLGGNNYRVQVTARNQGNLPVTFGNNFHVNLYLDGNTASPIIIWGVQASWFGVGQSRVLEANYTFSSGSHTLQGWADAYNVVVESNETNNILTVSGVVIAGASNNNELRPSELPAGPQPTPTTVP